MVIFAFWHQALAILLLLSPLYQMPSPALIIGVAYYERTPAKAAYAVKDANTFYDYVMPELGIPASNIKELVNDNASS